MYAGKILEVDLSKGESVSTPLPEEFKEQFLGGSALNLKLYWDRCDPGVDPLSPENVIVIGAGCLSGSSSPGSGKFAGTTKFALPATLDGKCYVASGISGSNRFASSLKAAGYDHIVIRGRSSGPVYLLIEDDNVEVRDASGLWGKADTYETTDALHEAHPGSGVMTIGSAGENLVRFALAITDRHSTMGRNGFGAVMGSKNLKAVVVKGSGKVKPRDPEAFKAVVKEIRQESKDKPYVREFPKLGIHTTWDMWQVLLNPGLWSREEWDRYYGPEVVRQARAGSSACSGCFLGCKTDFEVGEGPRMGQRMETGHFLDMACLAQYLNIREWPKMVYLMDICNRAGLDALAGIGASFVISMGQSMGLVSEEETSGVDFSAEEEKYASILRLICQRKGVGETAAQGWVALSNHLEGLDLEDFMGLEKGALCFYDMRDTGLDVRSFHMVVNPRGSHHPQCHWVMSAPGVNYETLREEFLKTGVSQQDATRIFSGGEIKVGRMTRHIQDVGMVMDSLGACVIYYILNLPLHMQNLARLYSAATGNKTSASELKLCGERGHNLLKLINVKEGFGREDDRIPRIWLKPKATPDGEKVLSDYYHRRELSEDDLKLELDEYYDERGWDIESSHPTAEKLAELGL